MEGQPSLDSLIKWSYSPMHHPSVFLVILIKLFSAGSKASCFETFGTFGNPICFSSTGLSEGTHSISFWKLFIFFPILSSPEGLWGKGTDGVNGVSPLPQLGQKHHPSHWGCVEHGILLDQSHFVPWLVAHNDVRVLSPSVVFGWEAFAFGQEAAMHLCSVWILQRKAIFSYSNTCVQLQPSPCSTNILGKPFQKSVLMQIWAMVEAGNSLVFRLRVINLPRVLPMAVRNF